MFVGRALLSHVMAMYRVMKYCCNTPEQGLLLKPTMRWDGSPMLLFEITGYSDLDWAKIRLHDEVLVDGPRSYLTRPYQ
jgi:hypothetical protein